MNDLTPIPTATLRRMYAKVRTIMFGAFIVDLVAVGIFAVLVMRPDSRRMVPFLAPILLLPTIALVPLVGRLGAIGVELKKRVD
jgi:hypothetical protein